MSRLRRFAAAHPDALCLLALLLLFGALAARFLLDCYGGSAPGGWDGVSHFALAGIYGRRIFPAISGWVPEYFGGFPFPDLYPPVFYLILGALHRLGVDELRAYWIVETTASAAVPLLVYACTRRLTGLTSAALIAGVLATTYMVDSSDAATLGISLRATFDLGEASHLPAFVFLLAFLYCFLDAPKRARSAVLAAIFFACVPLTNVHVVWNAGLVYLAVATAHVFVAAPGERRAVLAVVLRVGAVATALACVWVVPMFSRLPWAPTQALEAPQLALVWKGFYHLTVYVGVAVVVGVILRAPLVLALGASALGVLGLGLLPADRLAADLAIQPVRILAAYRFLATPLVGWLVAEIARVLSFRHARAVALTVVVVLVLFSQHPLQISTGKLQVDDEAAYARVLSALGGRTDGRVLVEHGNGGGDNFALQSLVGRTGSYSITSVFRESALDVLLAVPLRNALSGNRESFAVDSKVPWWRLPTPNQIGRLDTIDRARLALFNVKYLAATSAAMKQLLAASPDVERLTERGSWELYALRDPKLAYATTPRSPVLTFAHLSVKRRPNRAFDFVRLGEEQFVAGRFEATLALARSPWLDDAGAWDARFPAALLVEYRYRDGDRAYDEIEKFSRDHQVVALADQDPLYARIAELARTRSTLRLVARTSAADVELRAEHERQTRPAPSDHDDARERAEIETTAEDCARIFAALDEVIAGTPASEAQVAGVRFEGNETVVELAAAAARTTPVWIQQGYFPTWRHQRLDRDDEPVYLASPTFQLVWAAPGEKTLRLRFVADRWSRLGWLAGLGLLGLLWISFGGRRRLEPGPA